jgi:pimeloyl-ACP methyl ester carboxylesterase
MTGAQWTPQVEALSPEFTCLTPDLPGHGTAATVPFTLAGAAESVAATIDRDAGGSALLVGLSLGGYVAMDVAARWPERVSGLVLAGATAEPVPPRSILFQALAEVFERVDPAVLTAINTWFFRARFPAAISEPIIAGGFHFPGGAAALRALVGERFIPRLASYPGRTLLLNGEFDLLFRLSSAAFAEAAADARRVRIPGATHLTNIDRPAHVTAAIRRFAREVVGSP